MFDLVVTAGLLLVVVVDHVVLVHDVQGHPDELVQLLLLPLGVLVGSVVIVLELQWSVPSLR